jgi:coenzyme F420-reducing hydrogenase delta subunit
MYARKLLRFVCKKDYRAQLQKRKVRKIERERERKRVKEISINEREEFKGLKQKNFHDHH